MYNSYYGVVAVIIQCFNISTLTRALRSARGKFKIYHKLSITAFRENNTFGFLLDRHNKNKCIHIYICIYEKY